MFAMSSKQLSLHVLLLLFTGLNAQNLTLSSKTTNSTKVSLAPVTMHVSTTITVNTSAAVISVTQTTSTSDIFKFVTVNNNLNLGWAFTPLPTSIPSTITLPPSLSSAYTKCHNNCTVYPVDGLSWNWIAISMNESVTLATEFIIIDAKRNLTSTSTKYDTELLSKYPLPTDTNSAGTKTSAITMQDYYAGTPVYVTLTYPTQFVALTDFITWNGTLFSTEAVAVVANTTQTTTNIIATCLSYPGGVVEALPTIEAQHLPGKTNADDPKGWIYSLQATPTYVAEDRVASFYPNVGALHSCTQGAVPLVEAEQYAMTVSYLTETSTISGSIDASGSSATMSSPSTTTDPPSRSTTESAPLPAATGSPSAEASSGPDPTSSAAVITKGQDVQNSQGNSLAVMSPVSTASPSAVPPAQTVSPPAPTASSSVAPPASAASSAAPPVSTIQPSYSIPSAPSSVAVSGLKSADSSATVASTNPLTTTTPAASKPQGSLTPLTSLTPSLPALSPGQSSAFTLPHAPSSGIASTTTSGSSPPSGIASATMSFGSSPSASATVVQVADQTLVPGGPAIALNGQTLSLAPSATQIVVNMTTSLNLPALGSLLGSSVVVATTVIPVLPTSSTSPAGLMTGAAGSGSQGSGPVASMPNVMSSSTSGKQTSTANANASTTVGITSPTISPSGSSASQAGASRSTSMTKFTGGGSSYEPALHRLAILMTIVLGYQFSIHV